jgi:hypothetical protein
MSLPILTPQSQMSKVILPVTGNAANVTSTALPYGIYLNNNDFISGAVDQVSFTYKMLGGDVLDIEITEENVYTSYELAVLEYSYIINSHQAENVLSDFLGATTGTFDHDGQLKAGALSSSLSGTQVSLKFPTFTFEYGRRIATGLAQEAGFGDNVTMYSASFALTGGVQTYDLQNIVSASQSGTEYNNKIKNKKVNIHRVYYKSPATMWRFFGQYGYGAGVYGNLSTYGMYADDSTFEVVPAWQNKAQAQQYETDLYTRASHYAYEIRNNRITVYPAPAGNGNSGKPIPERMWFLFSVPQDAWVEEDDSKIGIDGINNMNTLPFSNLPYENINSMGKQWIRKYALAISKEMLGQVRGKFGSIPIPGNDVTLNASELLSQAKEEQNGLKEELKAQLDKLTYGALVKGDAEMAEDSNRIQVHVPMGIYTG